MKLFFDTEFTGLHKKTTLISLGIVSEDGKTFYAEFTDYDKSQINEWLQVNVINNLYLHNDKYQVYETKEGLLADNNVEILDSSKNIAIYLKLWLTQFKNIDFWSDCLAYDWVLLNDLLADYSSGYPQLPSNINYIPFDICTLFYLKGVDPDINREAFVGLDKYTKHNSLHDAETIQKCYMKLMDIYAITCSYCSSTDVVNNIDLILFDNEFFCNKSCLNKKVLCGS